MTAPNRVDDLRKRYHENPRRFFAPLANEYRKTGFIDRAILLCEKHLGEQPGNMNGLVVYGQCLFETGRLEEARAPFESALAVDPENLIALRHLGDIARLGGDAAAARQWYERVLEFDRRNDEVTALLAEVGGPTERAPTRASTSLAPNIISVASSVSVAAPAESPGMIDLGPPTPRPSIAPPPPLVSVSSVASMKPAVDPSAKTVEISATPKPAKRASLLDVSFDFGESVEEARPSAPAQPLTPAESAEYGFAEADLGPSAEDALDHLMDLEESATAPARQSASIIDLPPEQEPLGSTAAVDGLELAEFSVEVEPLAELEPMEFVGGEAAPLDGLEASEFLVPPPEVRDSIPLIVTDNLSAEGLPATPPDDLPLTSEFGEFASEGLRSSPVDGIPLLPPLEEADTLQIDPAELRRRFETPATFVTETMAQLYLQQGLTDKAIDVYRQLVEQLPADQGLKDRLRALELSAAAPADDEFPEFEPEALEAMVPPPAAAVMPAPEPEVEPEPVVVPEPEAELEAEPTPEAAPEPTHEPTPEPLFEAPPAPRATAPRAALDFDTPALAEFSIEPAPPADAMLSAMSFADVSLTTPSDPSRRSSPTPTAPVESAPLDLTPVEAPMAEATHEAPTSAREFFAAFARRSLTPSALMPSAPTPSSPTPSSTVAVSAVPSAAGGPLSPLDEIFGTTVDEEDERSAHRLAAVGATSGPSGGSALDSIFGEGPSAPMPAEGPPSVARASVPRASAKLRFDQFFASSVASATPSTPMEAMEPVAEPVAEPMVEPMVEPVAELEEPASADPGDEEPGEDDDLDQFQGWLRGLTQ